MQHRFYRPIRARGGGTRSRASARPSSTGAVRAKPAVEVELDPPAPRERDALPHVRKAVAHRRGCAQNQRSRWNSTLPRRGFRQSRGHPTAYRRSPATHLPALHSPLPRAEMHLAFVGATRRVAPSSHTQPRPNRYKTYDASTASVSFSSSFPRRRESRSTPRGRSSEDGFPPSRE
jgi:hypothetical protein